MAEKPYSVANIVALVVKRINLMNFVSRVVTMKYLT